MAQFQYANISTATLGPKAYAHLVLGKLEPQGKEWRQLLVA